MALKIDLTKDAEQELDAAADYYERQKPGLCGAFFTEYKTVEKRILKNPRQFPFEDGDARKSQFEAISVLDFVHRPAGFGVCFGYFLSKAEPANVA